MSRIQNEKEKNLQTQEKRETEASCLNDAANENRLNVKTTIDGRLLSTVPPTKPMNTKLPKYLISR